MTNSLPITCTPQYREREKRENRKLNIFLATAGTAVVSIFGTMAAIDGRLPGNLQKALAMESPLCEGPRKAQKINGVEGLKSLRPGDMVGLEGREMLVTGFLNGPSGSGIILKDEAKKSLLMIPLDSNPLQANISFLKCE